MKVSVIITLYKDLKSLKIVLEALARQTYQGFEIVIAEDDDTIETVEFLKVYEHLNIIHLSQPDTGRNKVIIQNKAIIKASGEYLFFIDGDIVPFKHFIEYSLVLAKKKQVLAGRRVNLPQDISQRIKLGELNPKDIEEHYFSFLLKHRKNREVRADQGIELNPNGSLYKLLSKRKRNAEILGCNFSCFKEDMIAINGFDEAYHPLATLADDTDLTWRFKAAGYTLKSSKNIANCFHLWHKTTNNNFDATEDILLFKHNKKENQFFCKKGLDQYAK